jgi:hypothetical protein
MACVVQLAKLLDTKTPYFCPFTPVKSTSTVPVGRRYTDNALFMFHLRVL